MEPTQMFSICIETFFKRQKNSSEIAIFSKFIDIFSDNSWMIFNHLQNIYQKRNHFVN